MKVFFALALNACSAPLAAQVLPQPSAENPRLQTAVWQPGEEFLLTALPETGLTVMLEPGERVRRVSVDDSTSLDVRVSAEQDSLLIIPATNARPSGMLVQTDRRDYRFSVRTGDGLTAAYLVQFRFGAAAVTEPVSDLPEPTGKIWRYRVKGDRSVRPATINDDGVRTRISFGAEQALPAVFAIGPTGDEQVVNGYMREGIFVIDRVYSELVFRIDKDKATARRNKNGEQPDG